MSRGYHLLIERARRRSRKVQIEDLSCLKPDIFQGPQICDSIDCSRPIRRSTASTRRFLGATLREKRCWMKNFGHVESFKRQFAEQEFHAIKRRCTRQFNGKSICIVVVKKGENSIKRTVLSSIVATLDINIQHLLWGEKYPGDYMWRPASIFGRKDQPLYGYVANLSVAKYARRQGIASNMLLLAMDVAKSHGAKEVFVHVHKDNVAAWKLYEKLGFKLIETIMAEQMHLMCLKTT